MNLQGKFAPQIHVAIRHSKSEMFPLSKFSLIQFFAGICAEIAVKTYKIWKKNFVKMRQKYEKVPVLQVLRSKVKILRRF